MDTRQLAAFVAVVELRSFSQAAARLGVTQPAVSLQIRSLEQRLGTQLLDRSGRRVEPTEAGQRLYRNAQRVLAAEEQLLDELTEGERIGGRFELGASTGPGGSVVPIVLGELAQTYPELSIALTVADTHRIVELVADRALELGVVGFARRHRSVVFEPLFRDQVVLACPPGHRFAGKTVSLAALRDETLILMQEGAGVARQEPGRELRRPPRVEPQRVAQAHRVRAPREARHPVLGGAVRDVLVVRRPCLALGEQQRPLRRRQLERRAPEEKDPALLEGSAVLDLARRRLAS